MELDADKTLIRDVMRRTLVTIGVSDSLATLEDIMRLGKVRHMPVVRGGRLVGVMSERDVLRASLSSLSSHGEAERRAFLASIEIGRVMSTPPIVVGPEATLREAALLMADNKIGCLPVVEGLELRGIVTETDLLHFVGGLRPVA